MSSWSNRFRKSWYSRSKNAPKSIPAYWKDYEAYARTGIDHKLPIGEVPFVVLDTETTGLDHKSDQIVSFGGLYVERRLIDISSAVDWNIRSELPSAPDSIEIHGLLNLELEYGIPENRFVELLVEFIGGRVIVGYRPGFDMAIINRLVNEHTGGRLSNPTLDIFSLAMRLDYPLKPQFVNPQQYQLDQLCRRFNVDTPDRHTAIGDAYATAEVFVKLLHQLEQEGNMVLRDLLRPYG